MPFKILSINQARAKQYYEKHRNFHFHISNILTHSEKTLRITANRVSWFYGLAQLGGLAKRS